MALASTAFRSPVAIHAAPETDIAYTAQCRSVTCACIREESVFSLKMDLSIWSIVLGGGLAGLIGAFIMNMFMRMVSVRFSERVDMIKALGSLLTGKMENAGGVGTIVHGLSGFVFGVIYFGIFELTGFSEWPTLILVGLGLGFAHGLIVSYGLMSFVSERHPIESFRNATIEIGVLHLFGHVLFGLTVGLASGYIIPAAG